MAQRVRQQVEASLDLGGPTCRPTSSTLGQHPEHALQAEIPRLQSWRLLQQLGQLLGHAERLVLGARHVLLAGQLEAYAPQAPHALAQKQEFCVWRNAPMRVYRAVKRVLERQAARVLYRGEARQTLPPIQEWRRFDVSSPRRSTAG